MFCVVYVFVDGSLKSKDKIPDNLSRYKPCSTCHSSRTTQDRQQPRLVAKTKTKTKTKNVVRKVN
jgi:hypothetical protein